MKSLLLKASAALLAVAIALPVHAEIDAESAVPIDSIIASDVTFMSLTRRPTLESKLPTNISRISSQEIQRSGAANAAEAIQLVPGVDLQEAGDVGTFTSVRMRGVPNSNQVQVMIDDQPVGGVGVQDINLALIPAENIERIEVVRGGSSVLYGPNAVGGIIHIFTKSARDNSVNLGYESRSHNTEIISANAGASVGGWNAFVTGNRIASDGHVENSDLDARTGTGKLGYRWGNGGSVDASTSYTDQEFRNPGGVTIPRDGWDGQIERESPISRTQKIDNEIFRNQLAMTTGELGFGRFKGTLYQQSEQYYLDNLDGGIFESWFKNRIVGADLRYLSNFGLTVGGSYERDSRDSWSSFTFPPFDPSISDQSPHHIADWSIYVEQDITLGKLTLLPAVRFDQHSAVGNQYNPRLAAVYRVNPRWKFSASAARTFRAPTLVNLYDDFPDTDGFPPDFSFFGNRNLRPEVARTYDLGTQFVPAEWLEVGVSGFYTRLADRIASANTDPSDANDETNLNQQDAELTGGELELKATTGWLHHRGAYTFQRAQGETDAFDGFVPLRLTPRHLASYRVTLVTPVGLEFINTFEYTSKQFEQDNDQGVFLPSYSTWNTRISQRWKGVTAFAGVNNVMDRVYADSIAFGNAFPQPGRVYLVGGEVAFGGGRWAN